MIVVLILLTLADLALAVLLIAVSGFILQGVNNTGPMMPEAIYLVALIALSVLAPLVAWALRRQISGGVVLAIAALPLCLAAAALLIKPN